MYQPKDRLNMEIEELRMLMVKVSQRRHEEWRFTSAKKRNKTTTKYRRQKKIVNENIMEHCNKKYGSQENYNQ